MDCDVDYKNQVPLSRVVSASIIDQYGDISRTQQRHYHWGARGLKELYEHVLPKIHHSAWIPVNKNTHTATLPLDFGTETFIGYLDDRGYKVPIRPNSSMVNVQNITNIPEGDKCEKCQQNKNICNDLVITEETQNVVINDTIYERTIVKKLYPNGDYYLETTSPVFDINTSAIEYPVTKEFIAAFDLKSCGCLDTTQNNVNNLKTYCPNIFCNYYAPCDSQCNYNFGYKIFEEIGLIQLDYNYPFDYVYIEYNGFISKIKGQYYVPYVSFETLVEWIKWRSIKDKTNINRWQIQDQKEEYREAKSNMMRVLGRVSLSKIVQSTSMLPKFDFDLSYDNWYSCFSVPKNTAIVESVCNVSIPSSGSGSGVGSIINNNFTFNRGLYSLAVKVDGNPGSPVAGQSIYQNNVLKNATEITYLFINKTIETIIDGDFTFNPNTGIIDRSPSVFSGAQGTFTGDTLIINYNKETTGQNVALPHNDPIYFENVATYDLNWTEDLINKNGSGANFSVYLKDDNGVYVLTTISITPDALPNPTNYHFDFGGPSTGWIYF